MNELLQELHESWNVQINGNASGWTLTIVSRKRMGDAFTYRGTNLERMVRAAWAGEPGNSDYT